MLLNRRTLWLEAQWPKDRPAPWSGLPARRPGDLAELIGQAARRRVTVLCAPAGAARGAAYSAWTAAKPRTARMVWVALDSEDDQAWFWARVWSGLRQASVAPPEILALLEDESPLGFPRRLAEVARDFTAPVAIVVDNANHVTDGALLEGLGLLIRDAPPGLRFLLSGLRAPALNLDKVRAAGELVVVRVTELAVEELRATGSPAAAMPGTHPGWTKRSPLAGAIVGSSQRA